MAPMAKEISLRNRYVTMVNDYQVVDIVGRDPENPDRWVVRDHTGREYTRRFSELSPTLVKTRPASRSGAHARGGR